ncbi:hypothetical protein BH23GEM6_BH23GEM6_02700 [soil metagenome]
MPERQRGLRELRREHPFFFWGTGALVLLLLTSTAVVGSRVPGYRADAALVDQRMTEEERKVRDGVLDSRARRSQLAVALLQRELRVKAMQERGMHLAISTDDSTLYLRHGAATLRQARVEIGPDSVIQAPDGQQWRFIRALGERHLADKSQNPTYTVPEWVYIGQGQAVPSAEERKVPGGLGRYVLRLDDETVIYSRPERGPHLDQVKPASYSVAESDLRAIFEAIPVEIPVYIY